MSLSAFKSKAYRKRRKQRASVESKKAEKQTKEKGKNESGPSKKTEKTQSGGGGGADEVKNAGEHESGREGEGEEKAEGKGASERADKREDRRVISAPPRQPLPSRESLLRVRDPTTSPSTSAHPSLSVSVSVSLRFRALGAGSHGLLLRGLEPLVPQRQAQDIEHTNQTQLIECVWYIGRNMIHTPYCIIAC